MTDQTPMTQPLTKPFRPSFTIDLACDLVAKLNGEAPDVFDEVCDLVKWAEGFHDADEVQRAIIRRELAGRADAVVQDVRALPGQTRVRAIGTARLLSRSTRCSW